MLPRVTGAESLLRTLVANGVDTCFMNPGTSEMHFVAALDRVDGLRGVLCLFEGVCSGAADGYARVTGRPAATLLHLGPGLGNSLANFHNARKARSPIVSIVGEHATAHLKVDAPLTSDIATFARTVSNCVRTATSADDVGAAAAETIAAACQPPGQIAMLIIPADYSWSEAKVAGPVFERPRRSIPADESIDNAAKLLRDPGTAVLIGGTAVTPRALHAAGRIAGATGVRFITARNAPKIAAGRGRFQPPQVAYFPEGAIPMFADVKNLILVESEKPVSFFAYPGIPSYMVPDSCEVSILARRDQDGTVALEALADACGGLAVFPLLQETEAVSAPEDASELTLDAIGRTLAAYLPDNALIADEMVSSSGKVLSHLKAAAPHEFMPVTGGSIGQGLPVALGAALACPDRKVIALEADGSGMYTLQALWTIARENLDVLIVIFANRRYRILDIEMARTGANGFGRIANDMIDIGRPDLDWVKLSEGCGVAATRALTAREFSDQIRDAIKQRGPRLVEAVFA
ncbi:MAG: acetolactate synthase large subunit [Bryobacteraceae bacterium]